MERHRFDALSFTFGALFVTVAGIALAGPDLVALRDLAWIAPTLLVLAGAVLLLSTARRDPDADESQDATPEVGSEEAQPGDVVASRASDAPTVGRDDDAR